jgi:hypothetical protein
MKSHCSLRIFFLLMLLSIARRSSARTAAFSPVLRRAGSNISRLPSWSGTTRPTRCLPQSPMYCVSSSSLSSKVSSSLLDDVFVEGDDYDDDFCLSPQDSDVEEGSTGALLPGMPEGFYVVKKYHTPDNGFDLSAIAPDVIERLELTTTNVSVPIALMLLDPDEYPSLSRARKASLVRVPVWYIEECCHLIAFQIQPTAFMGVLAIGSFLEIGLAYRLAWEMANTVPCLMMNPLLSCR